MNVYGRISKLTSLLSIPLSEQLCGAHNVARCYCIARNYFHLSPRRKINTITSQSKLYSNAVKNNLLVISEEVKDAINAGKAVVALESAIITHGMPSPANFETAVKLEEILRKMVSTVVNFSSTFSYAVGAGGHLLWLGEVRRSPPFFINLSLCLGR